MMFYKDFLGTDHSDCTIEFLPGDTEELFKKSKKTQPKDWYYRTHKITYVMNEYGHRSSSLSNLDLNNYALFLGCSHTLGVGLELEKTYPYILSQKLGMAYYNMSIPGTGSDVIEFNLLNWLSTIKQEPKVIVIQWPDHSRWVEYDSVHQHIMERGTWMKEEMYARFTVAAEVSGAVYARKHLTVQLLKKLIKCKVVYCNYSSQAPYDGETILMRDKDVARDLQHLGIVSHQEFAESLYERVNA